MALQSNVNVSLRYGEETNFGSPASGAGQLLRRVSSTIATSKDAFSSNEVRSDAQVFDARHGTRRAGGAIAGELSTQTYDDFLEAALRGTWATGATASQTQFTSINVTGSAFVIGGGSYLTTGFKIGDVVRLGGFAHANVAKNFRITALTATSATVSPAPAAMTAQTTFTLSVPGRKLVNGVLARSFSIEQSYPDIDVAELFTGMRVGEFGISVPPAGIATCSIGFQGQNGVVSSGASAPYFASPAVETATGVLSGVSGSLSIAGAASAVVTGLDFSINNNLSSTPVVGSTFVPDIFYGRSVITGNVSAYLENTSLIDAFLNETEIDLAAQLDAAGASPAEFLCFRLHRLKLTGVSKTVGPDGGVIASFPFQALLRTGGTGTAFDQSTMVVQRSNS